MRCEVVAIGTELLLGQIVDTNSSWIGGELALAGIDSFYQTKVGDNLQRIVDSIRLALSRSDAVITCGGLGPTQDDITREAIAIVMGVELAPDEIIAERIRAMFAARGRTMSANNLRQASVPAGAQPIAQMPGTAPGLLCPVGDKVIYAVPGVPSEMREMMAGTILPDLQRRAGIRAVIRSRVLRTWGNSESGLAETLADRVRELDDIGNPTLAFQASGIEGIKVRITAKAADEAAAEAILADEEARLRCLLGDIVFAVDEETMETTVLRLLDQRGLSLGVCETLTGGLMASRLTEQAEAESVLRGVLVVPAPEGDPAAAAAGLAEMVRDNLGAEVGLAAVAANDDQAGQPRRGRVLLGIALPGGTVTEEVLLPGDRLRLRQFAVIGLLNALRLRLAAL